MILCTLLETSRFSYDVLVGASTRCFCDCVCWPNRRSDRKLSVALPTTQCSQAGGEIGSHNRNAPSKARNGSQEVAEEYEYAVQFDHEANKRPLAENEDNTSDKRGSAFELLPACEEEGCLLGTDDHGEADEEEYLSRV